MESISPTYYAGGIDPLTFVLTGRFGSLPERVVGIRSSHNATPLEQLDKTDDAHTYDIAISGNSLVATLRGTAHTNVPCYFSAIVSPDRSVIYWVNETRPLH